MKDKDENGEPIMMSDCAVRLLMGPRNAPSKQLWSWLLANITAAEASRAAPKSTEGTFTAHASEVVLRLPARRRDVRCISCGGCTVAFFFFPQERERFFAVVVVVVAAAVVALKLC